MNTTTGRSVQFKEAGPTDRKTLSGGAPLMNGDAAVKLYVCEVGQVKLLTPQEETVLIVRIKSGDRKAREGLIKGNLRRVVEISREYEDSGLPLLDLISEGNMGLMKAVDRFEPINGNNFSAYSTWWIRQSIKRAIANQVKPLLQAA